VKGNIAIVAGTPTLIPIIPAFTRFLNSRAARPLFVKMAAPLPNADRLACSNRRVKIAHAHDVQDRAEDFLARKGHSVLHMVDDRRPT